MIFEFTLWYISILAIFISFIGLIFLRIGLSKLSGKFRDSVFLLLVAATFAVSTSLCIAIFGIIGLSIESVWWNIVPIFFSLSTIFFFFSTRSLERMFRVATMEIKSSGSDIKPYYKNNI